MTDATELVAVSELPEAGSYRFTVSEPSGLEEEVLLARTDAGTTDDGAGDDTDDTPAVAAWKNFCMHEPDQRLDRGGDVGAAMRDGQVICPRHGAMFDLETGYCDTDPAAGQTLVSVDVEVRDGVVYLTDEALTFEHEGGLDDDDGMPSSTSHLGL
ncbi:Rieske (2Fe-2S) protein [Halobaculum sp. MBLA0147]|uniref:Rieske (2Fe-2S) protein n=1 Tax=Halobaculum sp. MBLA0147 TaxID=3079934 RepID=UPI0035232046